MESLIQIDIKEVKSPSDFQARVVLPWEEEAYDRAFLHWQDEMEMIEQNTILNHDIHINDICAMKDNRDGQWHRVRVDKVLYTGRGQQASCYFVDSGHQCFSLLHRLYKLPESYQADRVPFQMRSLKLWGLQPLSLMLEATDTGIHVPQRPAKKWDPSAETYFSEMTEDVQQARVLFKGEDKRGRLQVILYLMKNGQPVNVNFILMTEEYACPLHPDVERELNTSQRLCEQAAGGRAGDRLSPVCVNVISGGERKERRFDLRPSLTPSHLCSPAAHSCRVSDGKGESILTEDGLKHSKGESILTEDGLKRSKGESILTEDRLKRVLSKVHRFSDHRNYDSDTEALNRGRGNHKARSRPALGSSSWSGSMLEDGVGGDEGLKGVDERASRGGRDWPLSDSEHVSAVSRIQAAFPPRTLHSSSDSDSSSYSEMQSYALSSKGRGGGGPSSLLKTEGAAVGPASHDREVGASGDWTHIPSGLTSTGVTSTGVTSTGVTSTGVTSTGLTSTGLTPPGKVVLAGRGRGLKKLCSEDVAKSPGSSPAVSHGATANADNSGKAKTQGLGNPAQPEPTKNPVITTPANADSGSAKTQGIGGNPAQPEPSKKPAMVSNANSAKAKTQGLGNPAQPEPSKKPAMVSNADSAKAKTQGLGNPAQPEPSENPAPPRDAAVFDLVSLDAPVKVLTAAAAVVYRKPGCEVIQKYHQRRKDGGRSTGVCAASRSAGPSVVEVGRQCQARFKMPDVGHPHYVGPPPLPGASLREIDLNMHQHESASPGIMTVVKTGSREDGDNGDRGVRTMRRGSMDDYDSDVDRGVKVPLVWRPDRAMPKPLLGTMAWGLHPPAPVYDVEDIQLNTIVRQFMVQEKFRTPRAVQAHTWPALMRGRHITAITPPRSGKTTSYLPVLVSELLEFTGYQALPKGCGPKALILVPSSKKADEIHRYVHNMVGNKTTLKVLSIYGSNDHQVMALLKGCDLLISTPHCLLRMLQRRYTQLDRLCHLVLDGAETLVDGFACQVREVMDIFGAKLKQYRSLAVNHQVMAFGCRWSSALAAFQRAYQPDPILVFASRLEASVYGKVEQVVHMCFEKMHLALLKSLMEKLMEDPERHRIIIATSTDSNVIKINQLLKSQSTLAHVIQFGADLKQIEDQVARWMDQTGCAVLVVTDNNVVELRLTNADTVVHFDIPDSKTKFGNRLALMLDHFQDSSNQPASQKKRGVSHLLVTNMMLDNIQSLDDFLQRSGATIPPTMRRLLEGMLQGKNEDQKRTLCPQLKQLGRCRNEARCDCRHLILHCDVIQDGSPEDWLPASGVVKVRVLHVVDTTHYYVMLLEHQVPGQPRQDLQSRHIRLRMDLAMHMADPRNQLPHSMVPEGQKFLAAVKDSDGFFHRAQVLTTQGTTLKAGSRQVEVLYVDEGRKVTVQPEQLLRLPPKLQDVPPLAVEVYICRVKPLDGDTEWTRSSTDYVKSVLRDKDLIGNVILRMKNTLWLDPLAEQTRLQNVKTHIITMIVRPDLLRRGHAHDNPDHVKNLYKACEGKIPIEKKLYRKYLNLQQRQELETETMRSDEVFHDVYISVVDHPTRFFIHKICYQKKLDKMHEDLQKYMARALEAESATLPPPQSRPVGGQDGAPAHSVDVKLTEADSTALGGACIDSRPGLQEAAATAAGTTAGTNAAETNQTTAADTDATTADTDAETTAAAAVKTATTATAAAAVKTATTATAAASAAQTAAASGATTTATAAAASSGGRSGAVGTEGEGDRDDLFEQGCLCVAKFAADDRWYRAQMLGRVEGGWRVFFVDHGEREEVGDPDLRPLPLQFCKLHAQAIECSLTHITPVGEAWSETSSDMVWDLANTVNGEKKHLIAKVVSTQGAEFAGATRFQVELYDTCSWGRDMSFSQELVWAHQAAATQDSPLMALFPQSSFMNRKLYPTLDAKMTDLCAAIYWAQEESKSEQLTRHLSDIIGVLQLREDSTLGYQGVQQAVQLIGYLRSCEAQSAILSALLACVRASPQVCEAVVGTQLMLQLVFCMEQVRNPVAQVQAMTTAVQLAKIDGFTPCLDEKEIIVVMMDTLLLEDPTPEVLSSVCTFLAYMLRHGARGLEQEEAQRLVPAVFTILLEISEPDTLEVLLALLAAVTSDPQHQHFVLRERHLQQVLSIMKEAPSQRCVFYCGQMCHYLCVTHRRNRRLLLEGGLVLIIKQLLESGLQNPSRQLCEALFTMLAVSVPQHQNLSGRPLHTTTTLPLHAADHPTVHMPVVKWSQNSFRVLLTVSVQGTKETDFRITGSFVHLRSEHGGRVYGFDFHLYDHVEPDKSRITLQQGEAILSLAKKDKGKWSHLLYKKQKCANLMTDFDKLMDSSDSEVEEPENITMLFRKKQKFKGSADSNPRQLHNVLLTDDDGSCESSDSGEARLDSCSDDERFHDPYNVIDPMSVLDDIIKMNNSSGPQPAETTRNTGAFSTDNSQQ